MGWLQIVIHRKRITGVQVKNITEELDTINYLVSDELLGVHDIRRWKIKNTHTKILKKEMESKDVQSRSFIT